MSDKKEPTKSIYARLSEFRAKVGKIAKDGSNPAFRSKYATLPGILEAIEVPLAECGLTFVQTNSATEDGIVAVTTRLVAIEPEGERFWDISGTMSMKPVDSKPQTYGSCLTYLRRYGLVTVLGLNVDDDDDGNAASGVGNKKAANAPEPDAADLPF